MHGQRRHHEHEARQHGGGDNQGRAAGAGTGDPTDLTASQVRTAAGLVIGTDVAAQGDSRFPSAGEKSALVGTSGTPGSGNKYVTDADSRNTDARTPTAHNHEPVRSRRARSRRHGSARLRWCGHQSPLRRPDLTRRLAGTAGFTYTPRSSTRSSARAIPAGRSWPRPPSCRRSTRRLRSARPGASS